MQESIIWTDFTNVILRNIQNTLSLSTGTCPSLLIPMSLQPSLCRLRTDGRFAIILPTWDVQKRLIHTGIHASDITDTVPTLERLLFLTSIFQSILTLMTQTYLIQTCMSPHHPNPQIKIKHLETHQHQTSPVFFRNPKTFWRAKI